MPFPETRAGQRPRSNGAVCRAMPVWIPGILNAWSIQISANVARFRGNVRSRRSGSMPLIEWQTQLPTKGYESRKMQEGNGEKSKKVSSLREISMPVKNAAADRDHFTPKWLSSVCALTWPCSAAL